MYSPDELCTHLMSCVLTLLSITSGMVLLVFSLHMGIWNKRNWPPPYTSKVTWLTINWFCSLVTPFASSIVNGVCGAGRFHFPVQYLCFSGTTVLTKSCIFFLAKFLSFRGDQQLNLFFSLPVQVIKIKCFFGTGVRVGVVRLFLLSSFLFKLNICLGDEIMTNIHYAPPPTPNCEQHLLLYKQLLNASSRDEVKILHSGNYIVNCAVLCFQTDPLHSS